MFGREALFEGFEGSPFQESRLGGPGKGVPSAAMGARVVEMRPLSRYASVAVRSRKANRLMLYTRFIRPIFALALTRKVLGEHRYEVGDPVVSSEAGEQGNADVHHPLGL